jgi:hypothetical protein
VLHSLIALAFGRGGRVDSGQYCELRATTDLMLTPVTLWDLLGSGTFGEDPTTFDDLSATNSPQKFYRIMVP